MMVDAGEQHDVPRPDTTGRDVVIYDGDCPVCRRAVRRLHRWDWFGRLAMLPLEDPEVRRRWPDIPAEQLRRAMHLITADGRRYRGAAAVRALSRRVPMLWAAAPLLHLPGSMPLWEHLYGSFAARRHRIGESGRHCTDEVCR